MNFNILYNDQKHVYGKSNHQRPKLIQMKLASVTCSDICLYIYKPNSHP